MMFTLEDEATVNLVGQHHDVAITDCTCDGVDIVLCQYAAGRILRRIQNDQLGAVVDQPGEFVDIEPEIQFLAQLNRNSLGADIVDHRLINGESRIRVDDLIPFFNEREDAEEYDWF